MYAVHSLSAGRGAGLVGEGVGYDLSLDKTV